MKRTSRSLSEPIAPLLERAMPDDFIRLIEARDFLRVHLPRLSDKQRRVVVAWAGGMSCREIARAEAVTEEAIHGRLSGALRRLRQLGDAGEL